VKSLNQVTLLGNLGRDVEVRNAGASKLAVFSLATTRRKKDEDGNWGEVTDWHNCEGPWDKGAEILGEYAKKGHQLLVTGSIRTDEWEKDGVKQRRAVVAVQDFVLQPRGASTSTPNLTETDDDMPF
jgi:single-strand DNA-binding protein